MKKRKLVLWSVIMALAFSLLAPTAAFAAVGDYESGDVTLVNHLITLSGLQAAQNEPDSWDFAVWDTSSRPYRLKELNLRNKGLKTTVEIENTQLEKLDISGNPEVRGLYAKNNKLRELNIAGVEQLRTVECENNELTQINFAEEHKNLVHVYVDNNQLTHLDVSSSNKLAHLSCKSNKLKALTVADKLNFGYLYADYNELETLNLENLPNLYQVTVSNNRLTNIHSENIREMATAELDNQQPLIELVGNAKYGYSAKADFINPVFTNSQGTVQPTLSYQPGTLTATDKTLSESNFTAETGLQNATATLSGTVHFTYNTLYKITGKAGKGGSINPASEVVVKENTDQKFLFKADKGYRISKVLVDGKEAAEAVTAGSYTFQNVTAEHTIEVMFEKVPKGNGNTNTDGNGSNTVSPQTGNTTAPILWVFLLLAAFGTLTVLRRKRKTALPENE